MNHLTRSLLSAVAVLLLALGMLVVAQAAPKPAAKPKPVAKAKPAAPTEADIAAARKAGTQKATFTTSKGVIVVELYGKDAPLTVANFVKLVKGKYYDGLNFHRVETMPGFSLIQGGDPNGNGSGGPGYAIKLEISPKLRHVAGALAMARSEHPDSAGSQFYICAVPIAQLDDRYAVFGKVVQGLDVVKKIQVGDTIKSIVINETAKGKVKTKAKVAPTKKK